MTHEYKVRLRFAKRGDLRLVSHHDLMRCFERMFRRAGLPVALSQGFNPRPKMSFPLALGLGIEGRRECFELELDEPLGPSALLEGLRATAPAGLEFLEAEAVGPGRCARAVAAHYELDVPAEHREPAERTLARFLASTSWPYVRRRPDKDREADLRPDVLEAGLTPSGRLAFRMRIAPEGSARPEEFVDALGLRPLLDEGAVLVRTDLELI